MFENVYLVILEPFDVKSMDIEHFSSVGSSKQFSPAPNAYSDRVLGVNNIKGFCLKVNIEKNA